jgi:very-short-patch-repair endonuclease
VSWDTPPCHFVTSSPQGNRLEQDGWIVLRFWNDDVLSDIVAVCDHILRFIGKSHP